MYKNQRLEAETDRPLSAALRGPDERISFDRLYHIWNQVHGMVVVLAVVMLEVAPLRHAGLVILAGWTPIAMLVLYRAAKHFHPDGTGSLFPNLLTTSRVAAGCLILIALAVSEVAAAVLSIAHTNAAYLLVGVLLLVELTDLFDGYVARRRPHGAFGGVWDMESDSVFAIALALGLRQAHGVGFHVVLIGLMKYLYVLLSRFDGDPPVFPKAYKMFAKFVAAVVVTSLILGYAPLWSSASGIAVRNVTYAVVLALQTASFAWDLVLRVKPAR